MGFPILLRQCLYIDTLRQSSGFFTFFRDFRIKAFILENYCIPCLAISINIFFVKTVFQRANAINDLIVSYNDITRCGKMAKTRNLTSLRVVEAHTPQSSPESVRTDGQSDPQGQTSTYYCQNANFCWSRIFRDKYVNSITRPSTTTFLCAQ